MGIPPLALARAQPRINIASAVGQVIGALQQSQTLPAPANMPSHLLATTQILGQDPGSRRPLGSAGSSLFNAWGQTAAAGALEQYTIRQGNGQMASVGTVVRVPPAIQVTDGFGRPVPGRTVRFTATAGGSVKIASVVTGQDGVASPGDWTLGPAPGLNTLDATDDLTGVVRVTFLALASPTRRIVILRGNGQEAPVGTALPVDPAIRVVEANSGQPLDGIAVAFDVVAGGSNVANPGAVTDQDGTASAGVWTLGAAAGPTTLQVSVDGADPVTFTARGI